MSVINRIEMSNFLNLDNHRPSEKDWRPHWRHVLINLRGLSGAIVATNGLGKSTANKALYALLSRDRKYVSDTRERAAPKRRGLWSHIRLEVLYQSTSDIIQPGLIGEDVRGDAYVFGLYGYSDDELRFYTYQGHLEDCPIAHIQGHAKQMVSNADFQSALKGCPRILHHPPATEWKQQIHRHFDPSLIHQLLLYQKAGGGDGAEHFFKVKKADGEDYDCAFFYAHIAPEVLVNCMDVYGEDGEYRFEDTLLESARPVLAAQHQAEARARDVEVNRKIFEGLQAAKQKADDYCDTQQKLAQTVADSHAEALFLKEIVEVQPVPGIPQAMLGQSTASAFVADRMVCCNGQWLLPDNVLAELLDSDPKTLNREAEERHLKHTRLRMSHVLENPVRLAEAGRGQGGGAANHGYDLDGALGLIHNRRRFAQGWDSDSAEQALHQAFNGYEHAGEPNPLRMAAKVLQRNQNSLQAAIAQHHATRDSQRREHEEVQAQLQTLQVSEHVLSAMRASQLFTADELDQPAATRLKVEEQVSSSLQAYEAHLLRDTALANDREAHHEVSVAFSGQTPHDVQTALVSNVERTDEHCAAAQTQVQIANQQCQDAEMAWQSARQHLDDLKSTHEHITLLLPAVRAFETLFPNESPIGLQASVQQDLSDAERRNADLHADYSGLGFERSQMTALLPDVMRYRERFINEAPEHLAQTVTRELTSAQARIEHDEEQRQACETREKALERGHQAMVFVQQRFGLQTAIPALERSLIDERAQCTHERNALDRELPTLHARVATLETFEATFGDGMQPDAVFKRRTQRLSACGRERDAQRQLFEGLVQQREELEAVGTVAGKVAREVLACVGEAHPRLHEVVDALDLPATRRAQVLTHFSHVLHFPVFDNPDCAKTALDALDAWGLEAPLFVRSGLEQFCHYGDLNQQQDVVSSLVIGTTTLHVRALINPEAIIHLKQHLDQQMAEHTPKLAALEEEYSELSPDSSASVLVRQAVEATELNARATLNHAQARMEWLTERMRTLNEHLAETVVLEIRTAARYLLDGGESEWLHCRGKLQALIDCLALSRAQLPNLSVRASKQSLEWIDSANQYQKCGGDARHAALESQLKACGDELEALKSRLPQLKQRVSYLPHIQAAVEWEHLGGWDRANHITEDLDQALSTLSHREADRGDAGILLNRANEQAGVTREASQRAQLQWAHWQHRINQALKYLADDGPAFDRYFQENRIQLEKDRQAAQQRRQFDFDQAQLAVEAARDPDSQARRVTKRDHLRKSLHQLEQAIQEDEALFARQAQSLQTLQGNASEIDRAVISILQQWCQVNALMQVIAPNLVPLARNESVNLKAARALFKELQGQSDNPDLGELPALMADLADNVSHFPFQEHHTRLNHLQQQLQRDFKDLKRELSRIAAQFGDALSPSETHALFTERPPEQVVSEVGKLYQHFERSLLDAEALHRKSEGDVAAARQHLITSITGFTDSLEENFRLLKRILDRRDNQGTAGLRVSGELIERGAVRNEIDSVVKEIDRTLRRREEDKAAGRRTESEAEFNQNLKLQIRSTFYRTVFRAPNDSNASGPTVTFQHPHIAAGRPQRLSPELSTGQGNALALLVLTKLADFTLHRDALADADPLSQGRRLRPSSTRVVIIDGLFSNLSNKRMIRDSLSVIRTLKGSFQLIGWIHNELYENDPELFPSYVALRRAGESHGFVCVEDSADAGRVSEAPHEGEIKPIELHADPETKPDDDTDTAR